jgi:hypothetical protein
LHAATQGKGKGKRGVAYLRTNALKGRCFKSLVKQKLFLSYWKSSTADTVIHGRMRNQVAICFKEDHPHLQLAPTSPFSCFRKRQRSVHRAVCHIFCDIHG